MRFILLFSVIALIVFACGEQTPASDTGANAQLTADKPDGEKIYKQYCVTCHGLYGNMGASGAANLQESELSLQERVEVITNGRNTMTPFKSLLSKDKIKAVARYTMEISALDE